MYKRQAFNYAFWPRDEDYYAGPFWDYAYDDVFEGVFWSDVAGSGDYATGTAGRTPRLAARSRAGTRGIAGQSKDYAEICGERDASLVEWPFARIEEAIEPTADQQTALDALREAADKATEALKAACPERLPATPLGRLDAMAVRMRAARQALDLLRPALNVLYDSLSDEQKARFNAIQPADAGKAAAAGPGKQADTDSPARICGDATGPGLSTRLAQRLEQTVHPLEAQRLALDELKDASARAVDILHGACPTEMPQTPPARLDAMRARIVAMLEAVDMVRPALAKFYGALSDEQKARFNTISRQEQG